MNNAINARTEFEDFVKGRKVICAEVFYRYEYFKPSVDILLKVGGNLEEFLKKLEFSYWPADSGSKMIEGTIWFEDGTWAERYELEEWGDLIDEGWKNCSVPAISEELK